MQVFEPSGCSCVLWRKLPISKKFVVQPKGMDYLMRVAVMHSSCVTPTDPSCMLGKIHVSTSLPDPDNKPCLASKTPDDWLFTSQNGNHGFVTSKG